MVLQSQKKGPISIIYHTYDSSCRLGNWFSPPSRFRLVFFFFTAWFCPPLEGSRWATPPDARLCRGAPPRCAHRDGVDAESGTGRRVTFWHCKGKKTQSFAAEAVELWCNLSRRRRLMVGCACLCARARRRCHVAAQGGWASFSSEGRSADRGEISHPSPVLWIMSQSVSDSAPRWKRCINVGLCLRRLCDVLVVLHPVKGEWDLLASFWVVISGIPLQLWSPWWTVWCKCRYLQSEEGGKLLFLPGSPPSMGRNEQIRPIGFQRFHCVSLHKCSI